MPMVRLRLLALATLALCWIGSDAAVARTAKAFKAHNFEWSIPEGWTFQEVSEANREFGHVAAALSPGNEVQIMVYASRTDLPPDDRAVELKQAMSQFLAGELNHCEIFDSTLSGVRGKVVVGEGTTGGGAPGHVRLYVIGHRGRLYHLEVKAFHGAHVTRRDEINAARKGFRLLKGGPKAEDKDEQFNEFGSADAEEEEEGNAGLGDWPAKGPKRLEDGTVEFTGLNLRWSTKGTDFKFDKPINDVSKAWKDEGKGRVSFNAVIQVTGQVKRVKKQEFEKDAPDVNGAHGMLWIYKMPGAADSAATIRSSKLQDDIRKHHQLDEFKAGQTRQWDRIDIGNRKKSGYMIRLVADTESGQEVTILHIESQLRGFMYRWRWTLQGHTDRFKTLMKPISRLLKNVEFIDPIDNVPGPFLGPKGATTYSGERGEPTKKKQLYNFSKAGFTFKAPEGLRDLGLKKMGNLDVALGFEWRTPDGQKYLYFDVQTFPLDRPAHLAGRVWERPDVEEKANKHITAWEAGTEEGKRKLGKLKKGGSLFRFRGKFSYRMEAEKKGVPYVEEGCWVTQKGLIIWVRVQFAGKGAENDKDVKKMLKAIKKGFKVG